MHPARRRDPDRLFPADPSVRQIAHDLHQSITDMPILSPHGHVSPELLNDDYAFGNPAELFVTRDHYVFRVLHSAGVDLESLGLGLNLADPRRVWRALSDHWHFFAGTASGYWLEEELGNVFGIASDRLVDEPDAVYDLISARLAMPEYRPRALFERFRIEFLATTDDPLDDLDAHDRVSKLGLPGRVVPTFRPDKYLDPNAAGFTDAVSKLLESTGNPDTFAGYNSALEERRKHFIAHGAVSADHAVIEPVALDLAASEAQRLFEAVRGGGSTPDERRQFSAHMIYQMARMSVEDGLVMTLHAGVHRNHSTPTFSRFGPDTGHDIPVPITFTEGLRPLLQSFGLARDFHLILFGVDESAYSRELAPLAGFYPSVYIGAPWWFLDAPDAMQRFRSATVETAGFYRGSGFIDDTRAFLSIPARHETARRADSAFLARMVAEGRFSLEVARRIARDLVDSIPREAFKL